MKKTPALLLSLLGCWSWACAAATSQTLPAPAVLVTTTTPAAAAGDVQSGELPPAVEKALNLPPGDARTHALEAAVQEWANKAPSAALAWSMKQPTEGRVRAALMYAVIHTWVGHDTPAAVDWVTKLSGRDAPLALHYLTGSWGRQDPAAAIAWADKQPKDTWSVIYYSIAEGWAGANPPAAAEWVAKLPAEQGRCAYAITAGIWAWKDPAAAGTWVMTLPDCNERNDAVARVVNAWTRKTPADLDKIRDWVKPLPLPQAQKDEIIKQFLTPAEKK